MALVPRVNGIRRIAFRRARSVLKRGAALTYLTPRSLIPYWRVAAGGRDATVSVRGLREASLILRAGTSDANVVDSTFRGRYHLPEWALPSRPLIWDLGANIGLTAAHLAAVYPDARIVAVELDAGNVAVARRNTAHLGDRCEVIHAGIWTTDEPVEYANTTTQGFGIGGTGGATIVAPGITAATLLERCGSDRVAFAKIDIEGAERHILYENTEWTSRVDSMKIEMHGKDMPGVISDMIAQLRKLGFEAGPAKAYDAAVVARRRGL